MHVQQESADPKAGVFTIVTAVNENILSLCEVYTLYHSYKVNMLAYYNKKCASVANVMNACNNAIIFFFLYSILLKNDT